MKVKLSKKEWLAIAVAVAFVGYTLFGGEVSRLFQNNNNNNMTLDSNSNVSGETSDTPTNEANKAPVNRNGVIINDLVIGTGFEIAPGKLASVHYILSLQDGTVLQNSKDFGQPFQFTYGVDSLIQGWDIGIAGMKVGGTRTIVIPPELGYGSVAQGPVPANSTLVFTIELLDLADVPNR